MRETFPRTITCQGRIAPELSCIEGDSTQVHQVLMNLCVNAWDAMPEGGSLLLEADNVTLDEHCGGTGGDACAGPYVRLRVSDTGTGIAPLLVPKIFDPFF